MIAVLQRVSRARVTALVWDRAIAVGVVILLGVGKADGPADADALADKVAGLRIFPDERGRFDRPLSDVGGAALVVPQFTLLGDTRSGRRPDFAEAAPPEKAEPLYERFVEALRQRAIPVETGVFRAQMSVEIVNDGPVTLILNSRSGPDAAPSRARHGA